MTIRKTATPVRTRARILALAALLGIAVSSTPALRVQAADNGGGISAAKPCYIPGSTLPYVTGEKATFSKDGQPAKAHTCQKDGTWTAIRLPDGRHAVRSGGSGTFAAVAP